MKHVGARRGRAGGACGIVAAAGAKPLRPPHPTARGSCADCSSGCSGAPDARTLGRPPLPVHRRRGDRLRLRPRRASAARRLAAQPAVRDRRLVAVAAGRRRHARRGRRPGSRDGRLTIGPTLGVGITNTVAVVDTVAVVEAVTHAVAHGRGRRRDARRGRWGDGLDSSLVDDAGIVRDADTGVRFVLPPSYVRLSARSTESGTRWKASDSDCELWLAADRREPGADDGMGLWQRTVAALFDEERLPPATIAGRLPDARVSFVTSATQAGLAIAATDPRGARAYGDQRAALVCGTTLFEVAGRLAGGRPADVRRAVRRVCRLVRGPRRGGGASHPSADVVPRAAASSHDAHHVCREAVRWRALRDRELDGDGPDHRRAHLI